MTIEKAGPENLEKVEKIKVAGFGFSEGKEGKSGGGNEDSFLIGGNVFGVFDGMGGHGGGDVASNMALRSCSESLLDKENPTEEELVNALKGAHEKILNASGDSRWGMGTTASLVAMREGDGGMEAVVAYVGDSPVLKMSKDGDLELLTPGEWQKDVWGGEENLKKQLLETKQGDDLPDEGFAGVYFESRHLISQALGSVPEEGEFEVETVTSSVEAGDLICVLSDGVSDNLLHSEIRDIILSVKGDLELASKKLVAAAKKRSKEDNELAKDDDMTAVIVRVDKEEASRSASELSTEAGGGGEQEEKDSKVAKVTKMLKDEGFLAHLREKKGFVLGEFDQTSSAKLEELYKEYDERFRPIKLELLDDLEEGAGVSPDELGRVRPDPFAGLYEEAKVAGAELGRQIEEGEAELESANARVLEKERELGELVPEFIPGIAIPKEALESEEVRAYKERDKEDLSREALQREAGGSWTERVTERIREGGARAVSVLGAFKNRFGRLVEGTSAVLSHQLEKLRKSNNGQVEWADAESSKVGEDLKDLATAEVELPEGEASAVDVVVEKETEKVVKGAEAAGEARRLVEENLKEVMALFKEKLEGKEVADVMEAQKIFDEQIKEKLGDSKKVALNLKFGVPGKKKLDAKALQGEINFMLAVNLQTAMSSALADISLKDGRGISKKIRNRFSSLMFGEDGGFRQFGSKTPEATKAFFMKILKGEVEDLSKASSATAIFKRRAIEGFIKELDKK